MRPTLPLTQDLLEQLARAQAAVRQLVEEDHLYPEHISISPNGVLIELHPVRRNASRLRGSVKCREYIQGRRTRTLIAQHPTGAICRWQEEDQ